jgi:large subunit ribosomal protein L21
MSKYAIIQIAGSQWKVSQGDVLELNRLETEPGSEITVTDVLLTADGDKVSVGAPFVKGSKVTLKVEENFKGDKIRVMTYKAKSRYRKTHGHRQHLTKVTVTKIA